jgi:hypothetical protein
MGGFGFSYKKLFFSNLFSGRVKSGNLEAVSDSILCSLREQGGGDSNFSEETYWQVVKRFMKDGSIKGLANLIIESRKLDYCGW